MIGLPTSQAGGMPATASPNGECDALLCSYAQMQSLRESLRSPLSGRVSRRLAGLGRCWVAVLCVTLLSETSSVTDASEPRLPRISFTVAVGVRAPIDPGEYRVHDRAVRVSYPPHLALPAGVVELPKSLSTLFVVDWDDRSGRTTKWLHSNGFERHLVVYDVLSTISELLLAYKLVRVGHADGRGVRAVGIGDTLIYFAAVDGKPTGNLNVGLKNYEGNNAWLDAATTSDPHGTNPLAQPHIGTKTVPLTRRYVRCFELIEHGFYAEAFVVAFSLLDDFVQQTLHDLFTAKGLADKTERNELLRGIKENRLRLYLGPLLKLSCGRDVAAMWPQATSALEWLNNTRNRIAHSAELVDYSTARRGVFACLKLLVVLRENGVANPDITVELFREAKIMAAWTHDAPAWVPRGELAETMDFRS
jgi:hypothetical protein